MSKTFTIRFDILLKTSARHDNLVAVGSLDVVVNMFHSMVVCYAALGMRIRHGYVSILPEPNLFKQVKEESKYQRGRNFYILPKSKQHYLILSDLLYNIKNS